jgi:hypothetical protein
MLACFMSYFYKPRGLLARQHEASVNKAAQAIGNGTI